MALYQFLCGSAVMIILLSNGCHSQQQTACGRAPNNPRIVGGQNAAAGSWPWVASIQVNGKHLCGGSLISDMWVLTAAHCVIYLPNNNMTVVLGLESMSGPNLNNVSKAIDKIIVHPSFNIWNYYYWYNNNDMALLKLSSPVNFTDYIQPVCLASANSTFYTGVSSWVVGFGAISSGGPYANTLQVSVVGNNECKCSKQYIGDNTICAVFRAGGNVSCQGDSGGPMMIKKGSVWVQSGVVSFGTGCAAPNVPEVYTRVSHYDDWIKNHTGSSKPGFVDSMSQGVDSDLDFVCPTAYPTTYYPYPTDDGSLFGSGERVISSLGLLLMSLYVLVGGI
ncbi:mast cell tryptase-like [Trematomus bernacchii]|uniref:mast cell tryptase-like n=1 Tax=Trematomus bernacchii TaxID=40690 RepID=UPI00146A0182|nr:mast cell tryptase-like [Trematomus bernacchii]